MDRSEMTQMNWCYDAWKIDDYVLMKIFCAVQET
jgi:hypothetical protein